jgi:hypothetical protein
MKKTPIEPTDPYTDVYRTYAFYELVLNNYRMHCIFQYYCI